MKESMCRQDSFVFLDRLPFSLWLLLIFLKDSVLMGMSYDRVRYTFPFLDSLSAGFGCESVQSRYTFVILF